MGNVKRPSPFNLIPLLGRQSKQNLQLLLDALEGRPTGARASGLKRKYPGADPLPRPREAVPVSPELNPPNYSQLSLSQQSRRSNLGYRPRRFQMGYAGKRFSRPKATRSAKLPCTYKTETSGVVDGTLDCAYIGHGPAYITCLRMLCMALYERLFKKHGAPVLNWNDTCEFHGEIRLFRLNGDPTIGTTQDTVTTLTASQTHNAIIILMVNFFYNKFRDAEPDNTERNLEGQFMQLVTIDNSAVAVYNVVAQVDLARCNVVLQFYSHLNIQNQSLADDGGDNADDVVSNPLHGRSYSGPGNGWRWKRVQFTGAGTWVATADRDKGVIFIDRTNYGTKMDEVLRRPPDKNMLANVRKMATHRLQPGQIRGDRLSFKTMISVNNLIYKLKHVLKENTAPSQSGQMFYLFGYTVFAFEKMMRTGASTISMAYEIDQIYRSVLVEKGRNLPAATAVYTGVDYTYVAPP